MYRLAAWLMLAGERVVVEMQEDAYFVG